VAEDDRSQAQRQHRRRGQCQAAVDRVHRGFVVVVDQTDDEPRGRQCPGFVGADRDRGAGMVEGGDFVIRMKAASQIALLVA
jgi:hypothetical protein